MQEGSTRARLVEGMAAAVVEKGYAQATIADVVRHAGTSKRTFYEHFVDKEACFLATYTAASDDVLTSIAAAVDERAPWRRRIAAAMRAYTDALEARPALTRTFLLEIHAAGPGALRARRAIHGRFAALLRGFVDAARAEERHLAALSPSMATALSTALVGGINELVLEALEKGQGARLAVLADTATALVEAVVSQGSSPQSSRRRT